MYIHTYTKQCIDNMLVVRINIYIYIYNYIYVYIGVCICVCNIYMYIHICVVCCLFFVRVIHTPNASLKVKHDACYELWPTGQCGIQATNDNCANEPHSAKGQKEKARKAEKNC